MTKKVSNIKLPDGKTRKALILALLIDIKNINWGIEMRMMNSLLKKINDVDFWFFFAKLHRFVSLRHLITQKELIFSVQFEYTKHKNLKIKTPEPEKLGEKKFGEDIIVVRPKQSLFDFVNT